MSTEKFPAQVAVQRHLKAFVLKIKGENPTLAILQPTFNAILDRFTAAERLLEIKQQHPGDRCDVDGDLSYSTASSYLSVIKQVRVKWGETRISRIKPARGPEMAEEDGCRTEDQGHVKALMHRLYEKAMLWEIVELQRNPMTTG